MSGRRRGWAPGVGAAAVAAALAGGCFSDRTSGPRDSVDAAPCTVSNVADLQGSGKAFVVLKDFAFHPDTLRVRPGTTVVWVNCDTRADAHTTTSDGGVWASDFLQPGSTYARRFDTAGQFPYHCTPHPFMKATITVDASAPAVAPVASP